MSDFEASGCTGKVTFDSFGDANRTVKRRKGKGCMARSPYRCAYCRKWHVGLFPRQ